MRFTSIKPIINRIRPIVVAHPAITLGLAAFLLYLPLLGMADLVTDEAKSALNIAYPHPPLVRWLMIASQAIFGANSFAVRLPVVIIGACGVVVMYLLIERLFGNKRTALLGAAALALSPAWVTFSRSGYLSVPLATCMLVTLLGFTRTQARGGQLAGQQLIFLGLAAGFWSELQAVLLLPVWVWWQWRNRAALMADRKALGWAILGAIQIIAFGLYVLSSPQIMADIFSFARHSADLGRDSAIRTSFLGWLSNPAGRWTMVTVILLGLAAWLRPKQLRQPEGLMLSFLAAPFILLNIVQPADYYSPYMLVLAIPIALLIFTRFDERLENGAALAFMAVGLVMMPFAYGAASEQTFFQRNQAEFASALKGERAANVVGAVGYEAQFYLPVPLTKWPNDPERRISRTVFVFRPWTLTAEDKALLQTLRFDRLIGPHVAVYRTP